MEDPKLVEYFQQVLTKLKASGYKVKTIRASFHEAAPKLVWQKRAYILLIDSAASFFGMLAIFIILFGSTLVPNNTVRVVAAVVLLFPGAVLYYFAIGAFKFHASQKFVMTAFLSVVLSSCAFVFNKVIHRVLNPIMQAAQAKINSLPSPELIAMVPGTDAAVQSINQAQSVINLFSGDQISVITLIVIILICYNLVPLFFLLKEKFYVEK